MRWTKLNEIIGFQVLCTTFMSGPAVRPFQTNIIYSNLLLSGLLLDRFGIKKLSNTSLLSVVTLCELEIGVSSPLGVRLVYDSTKPHIE